MMVYQRQLCSLIFLVISVSLAYGLGMKRSDEYYGNETPNAPPVISREEENSNESVNCNQTEFKCANGRCIPNRWTCDGDDDCGKDDRSDESEEYCSVNHCDSTEFYCPWDGRRSKCVPLESVSDGRQDCDNGEDENNCPCLENQFKCDNGKCIPNSFRCDGDEDCGAGDLSDENEEYCSTNHCKSTEFFCPWDSRRSRCIQLESVCDRYPDCPNDEDECSCQCHEHEFKCDNGKCIPNSLRCNGYDDCGDGDRSDESQEYCSVNRCDTTEFFCPWNGQTSQCISSEFVCDGGTDCPNGEDERSCPCRDDQFRCENGKCIVSKFRCDQEDDCSDNSDEVGCENAGRTSGNDTVDCRRVKFESKNPEIDIVIAVDTDVGDCLEEINTEVDGGTGTSETKMSNSRATAQVIVYKDKNMRGESETMELMRGRCSNVPPGYNGKIKSIDNLGNCVIIYENLDCVGRSEKIRPQSTYIAEDLTRIRMNIYIFSLEMC